MKDLPSDVSSSQITAGVNSLLRGRSRVLAGLRVNKSVEADDIDVNTQALVQLQNFISDIVISLRAFGKFDGKRFYFSLLHTHRTLSSDSHPSRQHLPVQDQQPQD